MIYLNNAATSFPKPDSVIEAVKGYLTFGGFSLGRGTTTTQSTGDLIQETRTLLAELFNGTPSRVILTQNATLSLNLAIHGFLKRGDHVVTSEMEHNSILRPLDFLQRRNGVEVTIVECSTDGFVDPNSIEASIRENTTMICLTHSSNVTGSIQPIKAVGQIAKKHGVVFLVDSAQSAGVLPIDMKAVGIDLLAFTGHKALLGPQGTGGLVLREGMEEKLVPALQGGTGIISDEPHHEKLPLPDKYEAGTHNCHGIAGLKAGVEFVRKTGLEKIRKHEVTLTERLLNGLKDKEGIHLYGPSDTTKQLAVVSLNMDAFPPDELGFILDKSLPHSIF